MSARTRRRFTDWFKADTVALAEESGDQIARVAKGLGIPRSATRAVKPARADGESTVEERAETR